MNQANEPGTGGRQVSAIVLAGGRSERFGSDKLAATVGGMPLLDRAIEAVAAVADDLVIAGPGRSSWPALPHATIRFIPDPEPFGGPLQALAGGLEDVRNEIALVIAGDMPELVPAVLEALVAELAAKPADDAVILVDPVDPGRRQPLPMALRVRAGRAAAAAARAAGDRSIVRLLDRLAVASLAVDRWRALDPDGRTLADVDRPEDLARLRRDAP